MTIHFAAARSGTGTILGRNFAALPLALAANENAGDFTSEVMLRGALRLFAQHGLGAAEHARTAAEQAFFAGDRDKYLWWLGVCRALDRRMAVGLRASIGSLDA